VMVSHELHNIKEHCGRVCLLHQGKMLSFAHADEAYDFYNQNC